jgi:hypothetical protein
LTSEKVATRIRAIMNYENSRAFTLLRKTKEAAGRYRTEARERKRMKAQEWAAINIRGSLIGREFTNGHSVVVTRKEDGTIEAMIGMTKERRRYLELWIQYFTVAPNNTIMAGRTMPGQQDGELTIDMQPFQVRDAEAVDILIRRMREFPR